MLKNIIIFAFFISLSIFTSCDLNDESQINGTLRDINAIELLRGNIGQVVFNQSAIAGRSTAHLMQYLEEGDQTVLTFTNYRFDQGTFNNAWNNAFYGGSLVNLQEMKNLAQNESNSNLEAIANILIAHEYGTLTNLFGDIPMSEALLKGENLTPKYDTQEEVYERLIQLLDEAIALIGNSTNDDFLSDADEIYNGNMLNWKKLAFGLKARHLLNMSKRKPSLYSEILEIVTTQSFNSINEQANFKFRIDFQNPLFKFGFERPRTFRTGAFFFNSIFLDPRKPNFTTSINGENSFMGESFLTWTQEDSTIPLFSFTELKFIEAEVLLRMGNSYESVTQALKEALRSNFEVVTGLTNEAENYINSNSFIPENSDFEDALQLIMLESYKAYYGYNHIQTWNNYRRTGYPALASTAFFPSDNNPSNIVPRRYPYPISEFEFNLDQVNEAVVRQNGALLDDDMWLFE